MLGLSGSSNDMRTLGEKAAAGDERAQLALDVFAYRVKKYIGTYTAVLGKLDAVVFTGGIGENAVDIRAAICNDMDQIGIELDPELNQGVAGGEVKISSENSRVAVLVIPTNEEAAIAVDTYQMSQA